MADAAAKEAAYMVTPYPAYIMNVTPESVESKSGSSKAEMFKVF